MKLPVLEARSAETSLCTYCPKLCRPACPVSTVEGRETVTPWGKMRAMGELGRGVAAVDAAHAAPAYACTGCMRCGELCELDNPAADTLRDGRAAALELGVASDAARAVVDGFAAREARLARDGAALSGAGASAVALVPGCTAVVFERDEVARLAAVVRRLAGSCEVVAERCCGLPLLEAGDRAGFASRARTMSERLAGFARVVVDDPGCAHAMRVIYPRHGVVLPRVVHTSELAVGSLASIPPLDAPPERLAYHDACRLGRGLGLYDEPRAVLTRLLGRAPLELDERRAMGLCSGAGALLPKTLPATSDAIARETADAVRATGAMTVATACPASRRQFARAGLEVTGLGALLARALGVGARAPHAAR